MNRRLTRDRNDRVASTSSKTNTGRTSRGPGRNSVPQNPSPPTTSLKSLQGLYANQHFVHVASVAKGCTAELQVKSGKKFEGILSTVSPLGEVELRLAHPIDSSDSTVVPPLDQVADKMLFKSPSIVCINIKDVDMEYASRGADAFQTDAEIAARKQNGQVSERELEAFETDGNLGDLSLTEDPLTSGSANGWSAEDMFKRNEQMGVKSSYDSNLGDYTTPLEMKERTASEIMRADRLAKKIEGSSEYNLRISKELEHTEEDRFSAVVRPMNSQQSGHSSSPSPVSASSSAESLNIGRYVPPALRNKDGPTNNSGGPPSHRNHQRNTPPPALPLHNAAGRNRAQSPHMHHPSHPPQQPYINQTSPHSLPSPGQRVQTPPHGHPAARNQQMPVQMQPQQHIAGNPRSPVNQPPLPQRIPQSGRRTVPDMGGPVLRSPVQSNVSALGPSIPAAPADKQSNVDKPGAGPQDVDKKTQVEVSQAQRIIPPMDRSPRASINDSSKKQTIEHLKEFGDNFMLQDKDKAGTPTSQTFSQPASPLATSAPGTPTQQHQHPDSIQQQQQPPQPKAVPATPPSQSQVTTPGTEPSNPAPAANPAAVAPVIATSQTPVTSTAATIATSPMQPAEKVTTPTSAPEAKKDADDVVKKSTLNPNAKEFNPLAKPFVPVAQRMQPQKTPTPPRPTSQPSPSPQMLPNQFGQQINQPIFHQISPLQPGIHYTPIRAVGPRKGATNLPQMRAHGQHDIQHILPVSMAAGQPLVAPVPTMLPFATHQPGHGGPVSTAQPITPTQVLGQHPNVPYVYNVHQQKPMGPRLATQQNMVAAGQPGNHNQHQLPQDGQVMVFPQVMQTGLGNFQHSGNIPISQQTPSQQQMPTPYHQFSQPQPQPHGNPTVQYQQHQAAHQQQQHPHNHQHTTPPLSHTPQGQSQGNVLQQPQPAHAGRPSPSPVNQAAMHQANQQQQQHQQQHQQHQQFHPQNMQATLGQPQQQNHQMMAAMAAANQQGGGGGNAGGGGAPHGTNNHNQQPANMMQQMHPHPQPAVLHQYPHAVPNITNVTPVHSSPHPHPKTVFLANTQGQHAAGAQQSLPISMHATQHGQQSILSSPVQGPYMQTPPAQLQPAQVPQFQPNN